MAKRTMSSSILLVALDCDRLPGMLNTAARYPFVVFGTMDGAVFADLNTGVAGSGPSALSVYFYETG